MTKVKSKALLHGTKFYQKLPGSCCVQNAGLWLGNSGALSCPPRREGLPHSLGSVWVQSGAGGAGLGVFGVCWCPGKNRHYLGLQQRQVCAACCRLWGIHLLCGSKETMDVAGQGLWTWKKAKRDWRLLKFQVTIFLMLLDLIYWQRTPKACSFYGWQPCSGNICCPSPCYSQSLHRQHFSSGSLLFSSPEKCLASLSQTFNWELSATTYFKSAHKFWSKENTLFLQSSWERCQGVGLPRLSRWRDVLSCLTGMWNTSLYQRCANVPENDCCC